MLVIGFFVGMLGNLLPLPGGIGGVDGGMIGAFAAFNVDTGLAVVAVLVYRAFTFWLPTIPGVIAYLQLRKTVERWRLERAARYTIQSEVRNLGPGETQTWQTSSRSSSSAAALPATPPRSTPRART